MSDTWTSWFFLTYLVRTTGGTLSVFLKNYSLFYFLFILIKSDVLLRICLRWQGVWRTVGSEHTLNSDTALVNFSGGAETWGGRETPAFLGDAACISECLAADGWKGAAEPSGFLRVESPGSVGNPAIARGSHRHSGKIVLGRRSTLLQGVVWPVGKGAIAVSPQSGYWAETCGGARSACRAFPPRPLRCLLLHHRWFTSSWGLARGLTWPTEPLRVFAKGPGVTVRVRPQGSCASPPAGSRGRRPAPSPSPVFSMSAAQATLIFPPPLTWHPTAPLLLTLSGTTKFHCTFVPVISPLLHTESWGMQNITNVLI